MGYFLCYKIKGAIEVRKIESSTYLLAPQGQPPVQRACVLSDLRLCPSRNYTQEEVGNFCCFFAFFKANHNIHILLQREFSTWTFFHIRTYRSPLFFSVIPIIRLYHKYLYKSSVGGRLSSS